MPSNNKLVQTLLLLLVTIILVPNAQAQTAVAEPEKESTAAKQDFANSSNEFIDDTQIKSHLYARGNQLLEEDGLVKGETLLAQLNEAPSSIAIEIPVDNQANEEESSYARNHKSTLVLSNLYNCGRCQNTHLASGGGVVLSSDGLVLTNYHVIDNQDVYNYFAMTPDGEVHPVVEVLAANKEDDIALVRVDAEGLTPVQLASEQPEPMSDLYVISHPHDRYYSTATGVVSRYSRRTKKGGQEEQWMEITAVFSQGSSGCGVFDEEGKLIGLVSRKESVHTKDKSGEDRLQMTIRKCVPLSAIQSLLSEDE